LLGDTKNIADYYSVLEIEGSGKYGLFAGDREDLGWMIKG
jgi:hypothetical protein